MLFADTPSRRSVLRLPTRPDLKKGDQTMPARHSISLMLVPLLALTIPCAPVRAAEASGVPVIVNDDGFSFFHSGRYADRESLVKALRGSYSSGQVEILEWCLGPCGVFTYGTKIGDIFGEGVEEFPRRGDKRAAETVRAMIEAGDDPLKVVVETAHDIGVDVFASFRMNSVYGPPYKDLFNGTWFKERYELRCKNKDGEHIWKFSYAYPEVRQFRLDIIREAVGYGVDGLNLDFVRHPPFFGYEEILTEGFERIYGIDPKSIQEEDPRWFDYRAAIMTDFVRNCRRVLDEAGTDLRLSARIDADGWYKQGCDVSRWVREGLLDILVVTQHRLGGFEIDLTPFVEMCRGTDCRLFFGEEHITSGHDLTPEEDKRLARGEKLDLKRGHLSTDDYRERTRRWIREGADGIEVFNAPLTPSVYEAIHGARMPNEDE